MSSATSTRTAHGPAASADPVWHIYALLAMIGAAVAVWVSRNTHPLVLVLLSAAVFAAGFVGATLHRALAGFFGRSEDIEPLGDRARDVLEREKALVLRSIKELEFDHAMGKIGEADFTDLSSRLRVRALALMQDLARDPRVVVSLSNQTEKPSPPVHGGGAPARRCSACGTHNDSDAKFCKHCGKGIQN